MYIAQYTEIPGSERDRKDCHPRMGGKLLQKEEAPSLEKVDESEIDKFNLKELTIYLNLFYYI